VHELIAEADVAVLPYESSGEGGSATLATCLAVGLPTVVSGAAIFDELRSVVSTVDPATPAAVAARVSEILLSPEQYEELVKKALEYAQRNSWTNVAALIRSTLSKRD
jgi:glycosyltransferase involved in cell wall biosynthesis